MAHPVNNAQTQLALALINYARGGGRNVSPLISALAASRQQPTAEAFAANQTSQAALARQPHSTTAGDGEGGGPGGPTYPVQHVGDGLVLPTTWTGTHVTSNLGWDTKTAEDIMGKPGTRLGAPEPGNVVYYHPEGAQGGGSILYHSDSGHDYWLGHIYGAPKPGTHLKRGDLLTAIANQRVSAPHVHIDRR